MKRTLRKEAFKKDADRNKVKQFHECLKAISDLKNHEKRLAESKSALFQEKQFHKNRWSFSKQIVNGTFGKDKKEPTFSKLITDNADN